MEQVLLVEDSKFFARVIKNRLESEMDMAVTWYQSYGQAAEGLASNPGNYFVAILDLKLPDALDGEIVDLVMSYGIPVIVSTGDFSDSLRDEMWAKHVIDYVLKEGHHTFEYLISLINRIRRNRHVKVLIVDDSKFFRHQLTQILEIHRFEIYTAVSGKAALAVLEKHPDIRLAVVDYNMPDINGADLIKEIRRTASIHELAIIGLSAHGDNMLSARFIKNGANDFIHKPFINEELYCRISQNLDLLDYLEKIRNSAHTDPLTGLYNRRYFLDTARGIYSDSTRFCSNCIIAMVDIDNFKAVNDTYGHDAGDTVLRHVSEILKNRFGDADVVSRFGGEEFCIIAAGMRPANAKAVFELIRFEIESNPIHVDGKDVAVTVSIGVCTCTGVSLDEMIKNADKMLYQAKADGRNQVALA